MAIMAGYFVLVQFNRSAGGVLANWLGVARGMQPLAIASVVGALYLASAIVQLPCGVLFDRFGARRTVGWMGLLAIAGIVLFAFSRDALGMAFGRFLVGVGHAGAITGIYLLAVAWAPPERVATATTTVIALAGGLGGVLATTPLAIALERFGLEATFATVALLTLAATALVFAGVRDVPPGEAAAGAARESLRESLLGLWAVATDRALWPLYAMATCFSAPFMTIGGLWAAPYLRDVHGLGQTASSQVLLAMMAALHLGTFAYGPLDRLVRSHKRLVLGGALLETLALGVLALAPAPPLALVVVLLVLHSFAAPFFVVLAAHTRRFVPVHRVGRAVTSMTLMGLVAVFVLQAVSAAIVERAAAAGLDPATGYRLVFGFVAVVLLAASAAYARARDGADRTG